MSDYTEDQLKDAARKALAAGDQAAAKRLVTEARRVAGAQVGGQKAAPTPQAGPALEQMMSQGFSAVGSYKDGTLMQGPAGEKVFVSPGYITRDPEVISGIEQNISPAETQSGQIQRDIIEQNPIASRAVKFAEGLPFAGSYVDEAIGAAFGGQAREGVRAASRAMSEQRPKESIGLGLLGGLTGAAGGVAAAPGAVTAAIGGAGRTLPAILRGGLLGAAAGGAEGAVRGYGEGTDPDTRRGQAGQGALLGGALGGALGAAAPLVSKGVKNVVDRFRSTGTASIAQEFGISREAAKVIQDTFDQGGDIEAARAAILRAGDEGMLADAGHAAQTLLDAAATSGGRAGQITREAIEGRMARTGESVEAALQDTLGPSPLGPRSALDDIARASAPARSDAYTAAYSAPINYAADQGRNIETALSKIEPDVLATAIKEANAEMRANGMVNQQIMAMVNDAGGVTYREMPNVQQLDEIKKALQRLAYSPSNTNPVTGALTGTGQRLNRLAGELRDAVSASVPEYGQAVRIGGDKLAEERAFVLGRDLLKSRTEIEDVVRELGPNASKDQIAAAKQGLRSFIDKTLGDVRAVASDPNMDARQVAKAVGDLSSDNARAKVKSLLGKEAGPLLAEIDKAAQSAQVRNALAMNSKTAVRQAVQGAVEDVTAPGMLGRAMAGEPVDAAKSVIQAITGQTSEYTASQRQAIFADIAKALTEKKGATARAALDYLQKAMDGQALTEAQNKFLSDQIAATISATAAPQAGTITRGNQ